MGSILIADYEAFRRYQQPTPEDPAREHFRMMLRGISDGGRYDSARVDFSVADVDASRYPGYLYRGSLFGILGAEQFAVWYDLLRSERAVRLDYSPDTEVGSGPTQLDWLILYMANGRVGVESVEWAPS